MLKPQDGTVWWRLDPPPYDGGRNIGDISLEVEAFVDKPKHHVVDNIVYINVYIYISMYIPSYSNLSHSTYIYCILLLLLLLLLLLSLSLLLFLFIITIVIIVVLTLSLSLYIYIYYTHTMYIGYINGVYIYNMLINV